MVELVFATYLLHTRVEKKLTGRQMQKYHEKPNDFRQANKTLCLRM